MKFLSFHTASTHRSHPADNPIQADQAPPKAPVGFDPKTAFSLLNSGESINVAWTTVLLINPEGRTSKILPNTQSWYAVDYFHLHT